MRIATDRLSRPLRDLRISLTDRCNFRCPYCMPRQTYDDRYRFLKASDQLDFDEIARVVSLFAALGVRKLRLTGGEPLLRPNLPALVANLGAIAGIEDIALTTNGVFLARRARELKNAGLHRVTVSLDSLDPDVFARMSGGSGRVADVLDGIDGARRAGLTPLKVNAVVQRDRNDQGVLDLVEHFRGTGVIVRFIEFMDVGTCNGWHPERVVPSAEIFARVDERWPLVALAPGYRGEVAARYAFADGAGEVGFISSVTQPFCGDCSRARLSSDGTLFTCLFATRGTSLRDALRAGATDERLTTLIRDAWSGRDDRYSELRADADRERSALHKIEMHYIGG
jgi:GTP 3',8-cyclase